MSKTNEQIAIEALRESGTFGSNIPDEHIRTWSGHVIAAFAKKLDAKDAEHAGKAASTMDEPIDHLMCKHCGGRVVERNGKVVCVSTFGACPNREKPKEKTYGEKWVEGLKK